MKLCKLIGHIRSFMNVAKCSNVWVSFQTEIISVFIFNKEKKNEYIQQKKLHYLYRQYSTLLADFVVRDNEHTNRRDVGSNIIWIMWWQGINCFPPIVRACYNSVIKNKDSSTKLILITEDNYSKYVDIPDYILDKVKRGIISFTHLSDIIRMSLLAKYGGLWLDSTIYVTNKISVKLVTGEFFSLSSPVDNWYVSKCKWSSFAIGGYSSVFSFATELFKVHWKSFDTFIDYYTIDYIIRLYYDNNDNFRDIVLKNTIDTPLLYYLQDNLSEEYKKDEILNICRNNIFSKLTWKGNFKVKDLNNKITFYGYIVNGEN